MEQKKKMRVVYIVGGLPFGGVENMLFNIMTEAKKTDIFEMIAINISGTGKRMSDFDEAGLKVVNISNTIKILKTFRFDTVFELRKVLKELQPDVIHTSHFSGDYFGRLAAIGLNIPVITHIRNIRREKKSFRRMMNKILSVRTDLYISISKMVYEVTQSDHNVTKKNHIVLYNTFDPGSVYRGDLVKEELTGNKGKNILLVGRLVNKHKRIDVAIKALPKIRKEIPEANLIIVGEGPDEEMLTELAESSPCKDNIYFLGYRKDVPQLMYVSDLLIMPSAYEGLPITHLEAMAVGLPAVISENVPSKEFQPSPALICKVDEDDLAKNVVKLLTDDDLYQELSARAKRLATEFTVDKYVIRLKEVYKEVISKRHPV